MLKPFSFSSPFSITRFNFFCLHVLLTRASVLALAKSILLSNWTVPAPSANRTVALFSRLAKKKITKIYTKKRETNAKILLFNLNDHKCCQGWISTVRNFYGSLISIPVSNAPKKDSNGQKIILFLLH